MKYISISILLLTFNASCLLAKYKLDVGASLSTGYSINKPLPVMGLHYKAMIDNAYPFDLGIYTEYSFLHRLCLQTGLHVGFENLQLNYADVNTTDSLKIANPDIAFELLNNPVMLHDETSLYYINVPFHAKYKLLGNVFIVAGINAKVYLHQRVYYPFELGTAVGFGAQYPNCHGNLILKNQ